MKEKINTMGKNDTFYSTAIRSIVVFYDSDGDLLANGISHGGEHYNDVDDMKVQSNIYPRY